MVFLSSIVLPIDDPETLYNESEAPINFAALVDIKAVAGSLLVHFGSLITVVRGQCVSCDNVPMKCAIAPKLGYSSNSPLKLPFTLRC